jgi:hypothetical protein
MYLVYFVVLYIKLLCIFEMRRVRILFIIKIKVVCYENPSNYWNNCH